MTPETLGLLLVAVVGLLRELLRQLDARARRRGRVRTRKTDRRHDLWQ